jgi:lysophospholipase L1-like esterase
LKRSRLLWGIIGITAVLSTLVFISGFIYASNQILFPKPAASEIITTPTGNKESEQVVNKETQIVALGDSLTAGTGDLTGKGYVNRVREKLEEQTGKPTFVMNNLAVPGYRSPQLLADLKLKKTQDALKEADLILFTIGGNDLFAGGSDILGGENEEFNPKAAELRIEPALERIDQILLEINNVNPQAIVMYLGLYHPYLDLDPKKEGSLIVQAWNDGVFKRMNRYPNMIYVPTYDLFERNLNKYLATDHFHPNQDGYERMADRVAQILK